jgi:hypothetical protein
MIDADHEKAEGRFCIAVPSIKPSPYYRPEAVIASAISPPQNCDRLSEVDAEP